MPSRLAAALIKLPRPSDEVADLLWRNCDMATLDTPRAVPSGRLVAELARLTEGENAERIAALLPSPSCIESALAVKPSKRFFAGLTKNPAATVAQLQQLGVDTSSLTLDETPNLAALQMHGDVNAILAFGETAVHDWFNLLVVADPALADSLLLAAVSSRVRLNVSMAARLVSGANSIVDTAAGLLDQPRDENRLGTPSALRILRAAGTIPTPARRPSPGALDGGTIQALRLAGSPDFEIVPLMLANDTAQLPEGMLVDVLAGSADHLVAQFLIGANGRHPRPGEALALLRRIGPDRAANISEILKDGVESAPWVDELLVGLLVRDLGSVGLGGLHALEATLADRLPDAPAWEMVLVMSEEWNSTLDTLLDAAHSMTVLH